MTAMMDSPAVRTAPALGRTYPLDGERGNVIGDAFRQRERSERPRVTASAQPAI
jgi:hypothetical protein